MRASDRYHGFELAEQRHAWVRAVRDTVAWVTYAFAALVGMGAFSLDRYCDDPSDLDEAIAGVGFLMVLVATFALACFLIGGARPALAVGMFASLVLMWVLASLDLPEPVALSVLAVEHLIVVGWCMVRRPTRRSS